MDLRLLSSFPSPLQLLIHLRQGIRGRLISSPGDAVAVSDDQRYIEPRAAVLAAAGLFTLGVGVHLAFAVLGRPPLPITLFAFGPPVALLAYLAVDPDAGDRRIAGLLLWGVAATAVAFVVVYVAVQRYSYLPEDRSAYELFRFQLDTYVWFVGSLAGSYAAAARVDARRDLAVLATGPLVQLSVPVAFVLLEQWFAARGGV